MSRAQLFVLVSGIALLALVLEMVRRRRLREEYSWLWLLTAIGYLLVALFPSLSTAVANLIGSTNPVSAFTFLGLFFLFLIAIQFSIQISRLASQNKDLVQHIAILDAELKSLMEAQKSGSGQGHEIRTPVEQWEGVEQVEPLYVGGDELDRAACELAAPGTPAVVQPVIAAGASLGPALLEAD